MKLDNFRWIPKNFKLQILLTFTDIFRLSNQYETNFNSTQEKNKRFEQNMQFLRKMAIVKINLYR